MKKIATILLSVLLIAPLFVSCDNATKAVQDELVEVTLSTQATGRSLTVSNPLEALSEVNWFYKATKVTEKQFNYGEKTSETSIILYPGAGQSKQILTLSQGKWKFELFGRSKDDNKTLLYHGLTGEVLILKSNGLNQITVEVSPYTDAKGKISFRNVKLDRHDGEDISPNYLYVTGPNGYSKTYTTFNGTEDLIDLNAGQYTVTVAWKETMTGDNPATPSVESSTNEWDLVIASETIVVTVYGGRTTEISGNISEETGSGTIQGEYVDGNTSVIVGKVEEGKELVLVSSVAPANSVTSNKVENTTVTFAKNVFTSDQTAILKVEVKDISSSIVDSSFTVEDGKSAVAGISLTLTVGETTQTGDFGNAVIETYIAKDLTNVDVKYNGNDAQPTSVSYTPSTGKLVFSTTHFSEYYVISDSIDALNVTTNTAYATLADAINGASDGDTVVLLNNTSVLNTSINVQEGNEVGNTCIFIDKGITIDGNGKIITLRADAAAAKTYGIYITGSDKSKTVTIKNTTIKTTNLERAIRTYGSIGFKIENSTITTNGVGVHVKGANKADICGTTITVSVIDEYSAHKRAGVVVGGPDAEVTVDGCKIYATNSDKTNDTATWCKGLYAGNSALNGRLTVNNTEVVADFSIAIDGTGDINNPSIITINSGEYSGIIGSPSGGAYKSLIINGGTFTGIENYASFYGKDNLVANLVISGGTFNVLPDSKFIKTGKTTIKGESLYRVVDFTTEVESKQGVTISGIAGVADFYDTIQYAYDDVKAKLVANSGLAEQPLSKEAFNKFFTDGGKITWTIYGNQEVTDTRMFSFGRAANRFGTGLHITEIDIVGGNSSASLDLSAVKGSFALPYNWWNTEDSVNTTLKCSNITFNGIQSMPSAIYQCTLYPTTYEFDNCTFNGNLYSYQNFDVNMTIKNCTFNAPANTQYAFFAQGEGGTITLYHNVFNNYTRGINLQRPTADFIVTNNNIVSTVSEPDRGAIQLTDGKSFVVNGNKVDVNAGNAFWFHNAASNANVTYEINNNDIKAPYIGYSGVTAFDVNDKITSSGNIFNSTDIHKCMKKGATVAEATNLTAIH